MAYYFLVNLSRIKLLIIHQFGVAMQEFNLRLPVTNQSQSHSELRPIQIIL